MTLLVGSLFSGIGGFDLGLERAGMRVAWQCEADEFCRRVLARHWPDVPCYPDVRELRGGDVPPVDVLCGGFPCQDISLAGRGGGIDGTRSGLWGEYARLIREIRPRYVLVENVSALLARGLGRVVGDLAALGYDTEWDCLPASAFGAPHRRDRLWLVAYPDELGRPQGLRERAGREQRPRPGDALGSGEQLADAEREAQLQPQGFESEVGGRSSDGSSASGAEWWAVEPPVGRVAHGIPDRLDQVAALGNALVPQIAEWLGRRILAYERDIVTELVA